MASVLLGMSGGIDSSVAAILLKKMGYNVIGLTMRLWSQSDDLQSNKIPRYITDAQEAAKKLEIHHLVIDVRKEFYDKIITYFKNEYLAGKTPNPCAKCNIILKWEVLSRVAQAHNYDFISTGHYVNITKCNQIFYIKKGKDPEKEQSFFLWGLNQEILKKAIFPLGNLTKQKVRKIAIENNLTKIEKKKESTGICFLDNDYQPFLSELLNKENITIESGPFYDESGSKLGKHSGYPYYTVGQRRGLGLMPKEPLYVKEINSNNNSIILGNRDSLYKKEMIVSNYYLTAIDDFKKDVITRIRYRKQSALSKIEIIDSKFLKVIFNEPEWSIAPGQTAAFYSGDRLLGGGFIYQ